MDINWADRKYRLEVNGAQLHLFEKVLDLYVRLGIGQFEQLAEVITHLFEKNYPPFRDSNPILDSLLKLKKDVTGYEENASMGINNPAVVPDVKIAYDLDKVIQKTLASAEGHDRMSVWHDGVIHQYADQPLATCEPVDDGSSDHDQVYKVKVTYLDENDDEKTTVVEVSASCEADAREEAFNKVTQTTDWDAIQKVEIV